MEKCPICEGKDFVEIIRGYLGNPFPYLKCTKCGKEYKKEEKSKV
jgi:transposase-like protein